MGQDKKRLFLGLISEIYSSVPLFCDGTPHDDPAVRAGDDSKRQAIIARGDEVWVYYYKDSLAATVATRPDIFRKVR